MSDYEMVSELVSKTGASFEEARNAYESCGKDMLEAVILLEKNKENAGGFSFKNKKSKGEKNKKSAVGFSFEKIKGNRAKDGIKSFFAFFSKLAGLASKVFDFLCNNNVRVSGEREFFSVPLITVLFILLIMTGIAFPVIVISLFCGVSYTFTGPDINGDIFIGFRRRGDADNGFFGK